MHRASNSRSTVLNKFNQAMDNTAQTLCLWMVLGSYFLVGWYVNRSSSTNRAPLP